ncbi:hypothetical protein BBJ28_00026196, partial [Nothophytophthora sp. Chile5]
MSGMLGMGMLQLWQFAWSVAVVGAIASFRSGFCRAFVLQGKMRTPAALAQLPGLALLRLEVPKSYWTWFYLVGAMHTTATTATTATLLFAVFGQETQMAQRVLHLIHSRTDPAAGIEEATTAGIRIQPHTIAFLTLFAVHTTRRFLDSVYVTAFGDARMHECTPPVHISTVYKATVAIALVPHPFVAWRSLAVLHVARPRVFGGALKVPLDPQFWNVGLPAASLKDAIQCRFSVQHGAEKKRVRFRAPCRFIYDDWVRCLREHMAPPSLAWLHYPDTPRESLAMMESPASARDMAILDNISYTSSSDWIETAGTVATAETDGDSENVEHETDDAVLAGIDRASSTQGVCNTVAEVGSTSAEPGCDIECVC